MKRRGSGVLLHITSLSSPYGVGDLGSSAYRFVDFLYEAKQSFWQVLPLNPTDLAYGSSPYSSVSAFAANTLLISPEILMNEGLLTIKDSEPLPFFPEGQVNYNLVASYKKKILNCAYKRFKEKRKNYYEYEKFCEENSSWLEDFTLFVALKKHFNGRIWSRWPQEIRDRKPDYLQNLRDELQEEIEREKFFQYIFFKQWYSLKDYCNQRKIQLIGDIPIYVNYDSADVWANPGIFKLDEAKKPSSVAGVPPDYFSKTGQLWGNPLYRWDTLRQTGYKWWIQRIQHNLSLYDILRVDHFRGFVASWEVPAEERTAVNGRWIEAPARDFFNVLLKRFPYLPIIAEDLGVITSDVREIMREFGFPGMRVLLFAFGESPSRHPYAPHNYVRECVVYTGTHDNNTVRGWFEREATSKEKERLFCYLGRKVGKGDIHREFIRLAMVSVANVVIVPMQDILGLGEEARMNRPATTEGNWKWRLLPGQITPSIIQSLKEMTEIYGRT